MRTEGALTRVRSRLENFPRSTLNFSFILKIFSFTFRKTFPFSNTPNRVCKLSSVYGNFFSNTSLTSASLMLNFHNNNSSLIFNLISLFFVRWKQLTKIELKSAFHRQTTVSMALRISIKFYFISSLFLAPILSFFASLFPPAVILFPSYKSRRKKIEFSQSIHHVCSPSFFSNGIFAFLAIFPSFRPTLTTRILMHTRVLIVNRLWDTDRNRTKNNNENIISTRQY